MNQSRSRCGRSALFGALSLALLSSAGCAGPGGGEGLNIYNWSDYIAEDTMQNFEKETGIKVRYDNFDNNEIVHAKLVAGKTGYDIVVPSSNWAKLQTDGGLLRKLDKAQLPNLKNLDPAVQAQLARLDPGNEYMVNWLWGFTTVGINVDKVKAALGDARRCPTTSGTWCSSPSTSASSSRCGVSLPRFGHRGRPGGAALPGQAAVQQEPGRLRRPRPAAEGRAPARHAVQLVGLHQRHGQRLDLPGARLVGRHQHRAPARHRRQDRTEDRGPDPEDRRRCCSST